MKLKFSLLPLLFMVSFLSFAQGTGDTNVSLYGNIAPALSKEDNYLSVSTIVRYDNGRYNVSSIAPYICIATDVNEQLDFQLWLTSKYASGPLTSGFSVGDLAFIGSYHLNDDRYRDGTDSSIDFGLISSISGGKAIKKPYLTSFATYPMEYQSTLGSVDVFVAYTLKKAGFNATFGFQQPITSKNQNNFYPRYFDLGDTNPDYPPSNELRRSADAFARIGYSYTNYDENLLINFGATAFYKIKNDEFFDAASPNYVIYKKGYNVVDNTKGLAANAVLQCIFRLNENAEITLYAGIPIAQRNVVIDGTSRAYFVTPGFTWNF
jgi:hypothetical protein